MRTSIPGIPRLKLVPNDWKFEFDGQIVSVGDLVVSDINALNQTRDVVTLLLVS